jgi:hypothetical protein
MFCEEDAVVKRWIILALIACIIIGMGLVAAVFLSSKTLASSTIELGQTSVRFEIIERDGAVYVSARERKAWSNGWQSIMLVGSADDFGAARAEIFAEDDLRVRLQVGKRDIVFDGRTRTFVTP